VCLPAVDGNCLNPGCKNYHPNTLAERTVLQQEIKQKYTKTIKMTKICTNFNSSVGCQYNPCKFIHVKYNDDVLDFSQIMHISQIERNALNILTLVKNLNYRISISNPSKMTELLELKEKYSKIISLIYKDFSLDLTFLN
jgi:hypothetical protein